MSVKDNRRPPWCWQSIAAMSAIRAHFIGERRTTAVAIYQSMTEVANDLRGRDTSFEAPRRRIAEYAGTTTRTLDTYVKEFEAIGVLHVDRRRVGGLNLPNLWHLVEPEGGSETKSTTPSDFATVAKPGPPPLAKVDTPPSRNQTPQGGETSDTRLQEEQQEPALTSRKKADPDQLPDDFPDDLVPALDKVVPVLQRVASAKQAIAIARAAVARTIASRPLKPHYRAACDFEVWALHGRGEGRGMRDVLATYRNWLDNEHDIAPAAAHQAATSADRIQSKFAGLTRGGGGERGTR